MEYYRVKLIAFRAFLLSGEHPGSLESTQGFNFREFSMVLELSFETTAISRTMKEEPQLEFQCRQRHQLCFLSWTTVLDGANGE